MNIPWRSVHQQQYITPYKCLCMNDHYVTCPSPGNNLIPPPPPSSHWTIYAINYIGWQIQGWANFCFNINCPYVATELAPSLCLCILHVDKLCSSQPCRAVCRRHVSSPATLAHQQHKLLWLKTLRVLEATKCT